MYVAMKDLEIRGAGNLLGGEQSGHIAGVGFDLYVRLVGEAVAEFRGESPGRGARGRRSSCRSTRTCRTTTSRASGCGWRRTSGSPRSARDADAGRRSPSELTDRYGAVPEPVANLLEVARFRCQRGRARPGRHHPAGNQIRFAPVELPESQQLRLKRLYPAPRQAGGAYDPGAEADDGAVGGEPLRDLELLAWCRNLVDTVIADGSAGPASADDEGRALDDRKLAGTPTVPPCDRGPALAWPGSRRRVGLDRLRSGQGRRRGDHRRPADPAR